MMQSLRLQGNEDGTGYATQARAPEDKSCQEKLINKALTINEQNQHSWLLFNFQATLLFQIIFIVQFSEATLLLNIILIRIR